MRIVDGKKESFHEWMFCTVAGARMRGWRLAVGVQGGQSEEAGDDPLACQTGMMSNRNVCRMTSRHSKSCEKFNVRALLKPLFLPVMISSCGWMKD